MIWDHWPTNEGLIEDKIFLNSKCSQRNMHPEGVISRTLFPLPDTYKYSLKELARKQQKKVIKPLKSEFPQKSTNFIYSDNKEPK